MLNTVVEEICSLYPGNKYSPQPIEEERIAKTVRKTGGKMSPSIKTV